jgi:hypothetical protein
MGWTIRRKIAGVIRSSIQRVVLHTSPGLEMRNSTESSFLPSGLTISSRVKARVHSFGIESREIRIETQKLQTLSLSQRQVLHHRDVRSYISLGRALYNNSGPYRCCGTYRCLHLQFPGRRPHLSSHRNPQFLPSTWVLHTAPSHAGTLYSGRFRRKGGCAAL